MSQPTTTDGILNAWAKRPLEFNPGSNWRYSNTNYVVAGRIIGIAAETTLFDFVNSRIFKPLGIKTRSMPTGVPLENPDALGYIRAARGSPRPQISAGAGWMFGAWPFALTAEDLASWDIYILNRTLLSPDSYAAELTTAKLNNGKDTSYALGLFVKSLTADGSSITMARARVISLRTASTLMTAIPSSPVNRCITVHRALVGQASTPQRVSRPAENIESP